ncbi:unnamed protein product [Amoebophrya sp. A120]|nr:unnamed protein product [Amoebophrya sp. A120]|eukprot:GSA120T00020382001.1
MLHPRGKAFTAAGAWSISALVLQQLGQSCSMLLPLLSTTNFSLASAVAASSLSSTSPSRRGAASSSRAAFLSASTRNSGAEAVAASSSTSSNADLVDFPGLYHVPQEIQLQLEPMHKVRDDVNTPAQQRADAKPRDFLKSPVPAPRDKTAAQIGALRSFREGEIQKLTSSSGALGDTNLVVAPSVEQEDEGSVDVDQEQDENDDHRQGSSSPSVEQQDDARQSSPSSVKQEDHEGAVDVDEEQDHEDDNHRQGSPSVKEQQDDARQSSSSSPAERVELRRQLSQPSREKLEVLQDLATEYNALVERTNVTEADFWAGHITNGKATTDLAQIEAAADMLQEKVDSVHVAELHSGKETARALRRRLNADLESFFERLSALFQELRVAKMAAGDPNAAGQAHA